MGKYEFFDSYYYGIIGTIIIIGLILILMIVSTLDAAKHKLVTSLDFVMN